MAHVCHVLKFIQIVPRVMSMEIINVINVTQGIT